MKARILIVEDHRALGVALASTAERAGLETVVVGSLSRARDALERQSFQGILLDLGLPDGSGLSLLESWKWGKKPLVAVVTAHGQIENAIEAQKLGVARFLTKPVDFDELEEFLAEVAASSTGAPDREASPSALIGAAPSMQPVFRATAHACISIEPLVIRGERGSGRTHLARLVAGHSNEEATWVTVAGDLAEGALPPLFEKASGGSLIIEEVTLLSRERQAELVACLDTTQEEHPSRLIVTTGEGGLKTAVDRGLLEEDLYYRLQVLEVALPPLRDRISDLPALVSHFLGQSDAQGRLRLGDGVIDRMMQYPWPGNVRELSNVVSYLVGTRGQAGAVREDDLPESLQGDPVSVENPMDPLRCCLRDWVRGLDRESSDYREIHSSLEGMLLAELLELYDGKPSRMARELNINRTTLRKKLQANAGPQV